MLFYRANSECGWRSLPQTVREMAARVLGDPTWGASLAGAGEKVGCGRGGAEKQGGGAGKKKDGGGETGEIGRRRGAGAIGRRRGAALGSG